MLFVILSFCLARLNGGQQASDLKLLYEAHELFKLRDAVRAMPYAPSFYRGAVAASVNKAEEAEELLGPLTRSSEDMWQQIEARRLLCDLFTRFSRFSKIASDVKLPDQQIVARGYSHFTAALTNDGHLIIPLTVNDRAVTYVLDTGAAMSAMSESDAARLGLRTVIGGIPGIDYTGKTVPGRMAVAERLSIGNFQVRNVLFWIFRDDYFGATRSWPSKDRGAIGIPVLLGLGTLRWTDKGSLEIGLPAGDRSSPESNLCFDGSALVAQAQFGVGALNLAVDTGAGVTTLETKFSRDFDTVVQKSGRKGSGFVVTGEGAFEGMHQITLPKLRMRVGGLNTLLSPAYIILNPRLTTHHGTLGMDVLSQAREIMLDFSGMRLALSNSR